MYKSLLTDMIGIDTSLEGAIALAEKHGFAGVDLGCRQLRALQNDRVQTIKESLTQARLRVGFWQLAPHHLSVDESEWREELTALPALAPTAQSLGCTRAMIVVLPFHETLEFKANLALHVQRVSELASILSDHGVRLGLEYIAPETRRKGRGHAFAHDLRGVLDLCGAVDELDVGVLLDSFHWHCARESTSDIRRLRAGQVVTVHINDAVAVRPIAEQEAFERELPRRNGVIDIDGFLAALAHIGYDGPVTCEPMSRALSDMPADEAVARVSSAMDEVLGPHF